MTDAAQSLSTVRVTLPSADTTADLAAWLAPQLTAGDTILIAGPIGAGKTHFCRSLIQTRLSAEGRTEDVPSPTYTLVQVYDLDGVEIWHTDLYRLTSADEVLELGLGDAFETAICLVEWPDRLGTDQPRKALTLQLSPSPTSEARIATLSATHARWEPVLAALAGSA